MYLTITIKDSGVGMSEKQIQRLFTKFTKFLNDRNLNREGVGLGLTISQNIAKALGGRIDVESKPGIGSSFILHLPISLSTLGE